MANGLSSPAREWVSRTSHSTRRLRNLYGELFVMKYNGEEVHQLTDNQWEEVHQRGSRPNNFGMITGFAGE